MKAKKSNKSLIFVFVVVLFLTFSDRVYGSYFTLPLDVDLGDPICDFACHASYTTAQGNDYPVQIGTNVQAAYEGTANIYDNGYPNVGDPNAGYGNYIVITHADGYESRYAHLSTGTFKVIQGQAVQRGQIIAESGNSGWSSGPHLHFEVRENGTPVDPYNSTNWLWTTNPPSHGFFNRLLFTFESGMSEGMTVNADMVEYPLPGYDEWRVRVTDAYDPAVDSPDYSSGIMNKGVEIEFSANYA